MSDHLPARTPISLRNEDLDVVVWPELGGRIQSVRWRGTELLRAPGDPLDAMNDPWFWSGFYMAPWCGRLPGGRANACGQAISVPVNFPDGTAIHGQVHRRPWTIDTMSEDHRSLTLSVEVTPPEFPWAYSVTATSVVGPDVIDLSLRIRNESRTPMPAGLGWHPWFRADSRLLLDATTPVHYPRLGAHGAADYPEATPTSFRLDTADQLSWGTHEVLAGGQPSIQLTWPDLRRSLRMSVHSATPHVVIYADEGTRSVAVEPQTHSLDGFRRLHGLPGALSVLQSGEEFRLSVTMNFA